MLACLHQRVKGHTHLTRAFAYVRVLKRGEKSKTRSGIITRYKTQKLDNRRIIRIIIYGTFCYNNNYYVYRARSPATFDLTLPLQSIEM